MYRDWVRVYSTMVYYGGTYITVYIGFIFEQARKRFLKCSRVFFSSFFRFFFHLNDKHTHTHEQKAISQSTRRNLGCLSKSFQRRTQCYTFVHTLCVLCECVIYRQSFLIFNVHLAARAPNISARFFFFPFFFSLSVFCSSSLLHTSF